MMLNTTSSTPSQTEKIMTKSPADQGIAAAKTDDIKRAHKELALDRLVFLTHEIKHLAKAIWAHADDHMDVSPDEVNWGHVGSADKARQDLQEIVNFLGIDGRPI